MRYALRNENISREIAGKYKIQDINVTYLMISISFINVVFRVQFLIFTNKKCSSVLKRRNHFTLYELNNKRIIEHPKPNNNSIFNSKTNIKSGKFSN